jgi:MinD-like ATPase involved in chromosome partitioning or flagellar assembly
VPPGPAASQAPPSPDRGPGSAAPPQAPPGRGPAANHAPADRYREPERYDPARPWVPGDPYVPEAWGRGDLYGGADPYGPPEDYYPADPYGPADPYTSEGYGRADLYGAPGRGVADPYRPAGGYLPGPGGSAPPRGTAPPPGASQREAPSSYRPFAGQEPQAVQPSGPPGAAPPATGQPGGPGSPGGPSGPPAASPPGRGSQVPVPPSGQPGAAAPPRPPAQAPPAPAGQAPPAQTGSAQTGPPQTGPAQAPPRGQAAPAGAGQQAAPGALPAPPDAAHSGEAGGGLTQDFLLPGRRRAPAPGWRRVVYHATGGLMRVPASSAELRRRDMINRVRTPVAGGHHRVAVLSLKGGVGKTTTTVGLGATLASLRGDRVIAVDANPDRGTLSDKVRLETAATVRDLLNERGHIRRYADVRTFTSQAPSRLEVLASDRDPTVSVAFSDQDYAMVAKVLEHYYSICLTDCGTGLLHSAMAGVLRLADQIVLVSSPSVDGARSASATLDWLAAHSYGDLVRNAVVVLSMVRPRSKSSVDLNRLEEHFASRCRAVVRIPYDSHLEEGAEFELDLLSRPTADAYLTLAAVIGDGLAMPARARRV